jgi:hypothetical protein
MAESKRESKRDVLERVQSLVKLAQDGDDEENRTAASKAVQLMKQHELVLVPKSEIDRVQRVVDEANKLVEGNKTEKHKNMAMGALAGFMLAKSGIKLG